MTTLSPSWLALAVPKIEAICSSEKSSSCSVITDTQTASVASRHSLQTGPSTEALRNLAMTSQAMGSRYLGYRWALYTSSLWRVCPYPR